MARVRGYRELLELGVPRQRLRDRVTDGRIAIVSRGVYGPAVNDHIDHLRAVLLRLPGDVVLSHQSAAALYGFAVIGAERVHVTFPAGMAKPRIRGVTAHESALPVTAVQHPFGVRCAPPARVAVDLARSYRRPDALATLDAALRARLCTADELADEALLHHGLRGVRHARDLVPLADAGAECRQESHLRLLLIDGRLPVPATQVWVSGPSGESGYRLDLAYEERKVGIEYDGRSHTDRSRLAADRRRMNWLAQSGWTMRYFTATDLYQFPASVIESIAAALGRR
ncbi:DUF559 domain-containing protein [Dactylosporangium sp. NPDC048998]|uniref:DUF559 domain-containing protein n=1 Tax=Dactylosporangium sp. NPDC048998 TaxID=3363976 RepID=UPI003711EECE